MINVAEVGTDMNSMTINMIRNPNSLEEKTAEQIKWAIRSADKLRQETQDEGLRQEAADFIKKAAEKSEALGVNVNIPGERVLETDQTL